MNAWLGRPLKHKVSWYRPARGLKIFTIFLTNNFTCKGRIYDQLNDLRNAFRTFFLAQMRYVSYLKVDASKSNQDCVTYTLNQLYLSVTF